MVVFNGTMNCPLIFLPQTQYCSAFVAPTAPRPKPSRLWSWSVGLKGNIWCYQHYNFFYVTDIDWTFYSLIKNYEKITLIFKFIVRSTTPKLQIINYYVSKPQWKLKNMFCFSWLALFLSGVTQTALLNFSRRSLGLLCSSVSMQLAVPCVTGNHWGLGVKC